MAKAHSATITILTCMLMIGCFTIDPVGPDSGTYRIVRGGGWYSNRGLESV